MGTQLGLFVEHEKLARKAGSRSAYEFQACANTNEGWDEWPSSETFVGGCQFGKIYARQIA